MNFILHIIILYIISIYLFERFYNFYDYFKNLYIKLYFKEILVKELMSLKNIKKIIISDNSINYIFTKNKNYFFKETSLNSKTFQDLLKKNKNNIIKRSYDWIYRLFFYIGIFLTIEFFFRNIIITDDSQFKNKVSNIRLADIGGNFNPIKQTMEFINIIKNPSIYIEKGARLPKGILFEGPPGVGKTMLAKAISNENNIEFLYANASDFSKKYIGDGSEYIKQIFKYAKKKQPCVIFIDELDSIGKRNLQNDPVSNEKTAVINTLLSEMDGFKTDYQNRILVIGATNNIESIEKAILRPGRFDRIVKFFLPELKERIDIIEKSIKNTKLNSNPELNNKVLMKYIAEETEDFSGACISNLLNEIIIKYLTTKKKIDKKLVSETINEILYGRIENYDIDETVAYHESGHALMGLMLDRKVKIMSIFKRNKTLGFVKYFDFDNVNKQVDLIKMIMCAMAGRVADEIFNKYRSGGAISDIQKLNMIVNIYITKYGMSKLSLLDDTYLPKDVIFVEKKKIIDFFYDKVYTLISKNKNLIEILKKDVIDKGSSKEDLDQDYFEIFHETHKNNYDYGINYFNKSNLKSYIKTLI